MPMQIDPNSYPGTACYGGPANMCDGLGVLPFDLPSGRVVLVCRLHYYQHRIADTRCDARLLVDVQSDQRVRCEAPWKHIYKTSQREYKHLCGFHMAFMDFAKAQDEQQEASA